jgi:hypothetical protein
MSATISRLDEAKEDNFLAAATAGLDVSALHLVHVRGYGQYLPRSM